MVKLKTVLDIRRAKADGTFSILFRVTNHKEVKYISSGFAVSQAQWDEKTSSLNKQHPNAGTLNSSISKRFHEIQKAIVTLDDANQYSFESLKAKFTHDQTIAPLPEQKRQTFIEFSQQVIDAMIEVKRVGNALVYRTAVNRLMSHSNRDSLTFQEIDYNFLEAFKDKLTKEGIKKNSIGNYFRSIRALYNKAIKAKVVEREYYPFHDITIKTEKTAKRAISINELKEIFYYKKKPNTQIWHASNYFFLSFALRGISFTDMAYLKPNNIYKGYLTYRRRKTKKFYTIKLHPKAMQILNYYKDNPTDYLLPVFPKGTIEDSEGSKKITRQWIKTTNRYLNLIAKSCGFKVNLTTYVTRHTWATIAKKLGYSNEMIAEGMGHEYGNKITNIYLDDFDQSLIDQMNDKVIINIIPCLKQIQYPCKFTLRPSIDLHKYKLQKTSLSTYSHDNFL